MKKLMSILAILLYAFSLSSCSDSENADIKKQETDITTSCQSGDENGLFNIFFKPPVGWFGDPFPYYENGTFYIYYLQDWRGIHPYLHPFHLVTTTDISSFNYEGEMLPVGLSSAQDAALCTGSIIKSKENGVYYMFYAGHKSNNDPNTPTQAVLLALSRDLKNWIKDETFYLSINANGYNRNDFRDPYVFFDEDTNMYKMIVTTQKDGKGTLALYTSSDLHSWVLQEPFFTEPSVPILECADLFKEGNWWYLIYSNVNDRKVHYRYSESQNGPWITPANSALDGIAYYAGKTASDGISRYIFGWCPTRIGDGAEDQWGGSLVTHRIVSQEDGKLKVTIPPAMDNKFLNKAEIPALKQSENVTKNESSYILQENANVTFPRINQACKIVTSIKASGNNDIFGFTFGACDDNDETYHVTFDLSNNKLLMYKDLENIKALQTEVDLPVPSNMIFNIKIVIEKSVCVTYINNEIVFTNRITKMNQNPWRIFSEIGDVEFSNIQVYNE